MKKLLLAWLPVVGLLALPAQTKAFCKIDCGLGAYFKIQCGCNKQFNIGAFKSFSWTSFDDCWANGGCNYCAAQGPPPRYCGGPPGPPRPPFPYGACPNGPAGYPGTLPPMLGGGFPQGGPWYQYWPQPGQFQMPAPTGGPAAFGMMTLPPSMCMGGACPMPCPTPGPCLPPAASTTQPSGPSLTPANPPPAPKDGAAVPGPGPVEPVKPAYYPSIRPVSYRPRLTAPPSRPAAPAKPVTPSKPKPVAPSYWYPD